MYNGFMQKTVSCRSLNGQFLPGFSGNPGGRPKDEFKLAELARSYTVEAIETLVDLMRYSKGDRVRGTASQALLDRGWARVAASSGQSYIEALQAVAEVIKLRSDNVACCLLRWH